MLSEGEHTITVTGVDKHNLGGQDAVTVTVSPPPVDLPPVVQITNPDHGDNIIPNQPLGLVKVTLQGTAADPEDGGLTGTSLVWRVRTNGGAWQVVGTGNNLPVQLSDGGTCYEPWVHEIRLTATDSGGNVRSDTVVINEDFFWCNPD
jgi:hypothetical protein